MSPRTVEVKIKLDIFDNRLVSGFIVLLKQWQNFSHVAPLRNYCTAAMPLLPTVENIDNF